MKILIRAISFLMLVASFEANSQVLDFQKLDCKVSLKHDTLIIGNSQIKRTWLWNAGDLISVKLENQQAQQSFKLLNDKPDLQLQSQNVKASDATINAEWVNNSAQFTQHLKVLIHYSLGNLKIRKVLKLYPDCPAITTEIFLKGDVKGDWFSGNSNSNVTQLKNVEEVPQAANAGQFPITEQLFLPGKHHQLKSIEFFDVTDFNNTLTQSTKILSYWFDFALRGNLLFSENTETEAGVFILKEAPNSKSQLYYPGSDFIAGNGKIKMLGLGVQASDLSDNVWTKAYGYTTGVYAKGESNGIVALRNYQKRIRPLLAERDEMIMLNTWGDRGKDTKINEAFCLNELELASKLGITHFQIDDGWQAGKSANSAFGGSFKNIWSNPNYWEPDSIKFPEGLKNIIAKGDELGIQVCLWFNPSVQDNFKDWEKDADALLKLYRKYGVKTFKIDGLKIDTKQAEVRLRLLFDKVMKESDWNIVLNLDATAGTRGGYFSFNEYGNIFLENRYTDWQNYYPFWTLRNLWMLSQYVPAQNFQIEFLNNWRNQDKYASDDRFAPKNYSFDYLFAISLMAQPLAWLEASNLPAEAFAISESIKKYHTIQHDLHQGDIFPIGDEPNGKSWTGFESVQENHGYILVFREDNNRSSFTFKTRFKPGNRVVLEPVIGNGKSFKTKTGTEGEINFSLPKMNSYALYRVSYY